MLQRCKQAKADDDSRLLGQTLEDLKDDNSRTVQLDEEVLVSEFADGAFAELDPFTSMIWPYDVEEFNKSTQGEFSGVGIQIQLDDDGSLKVVSPLEDSPAYRAGIKAGDIITRINKKSARGITINQAVKTITGVEGTNVTLTIRSQTKDGPIERDFTIRREKIKVASVKGWQHLPGGGWEYFVDPDQKIAYLRITNFTKGTGDELSRAVEDMKSRDAKAIIIDLRYNPGGLLTAATDVADKFLADGTIVSTKTDPSRESTPQPPLEAHRSSDDCDLPLVVLVNQYSASASEIVSGALKDWKRALIVGERTFGKGSVQMLFPLRDKSAYLKLTTSHYYLPMGKCIHREENSTSWGVDPDVTVEMTPEQMRAAIDARQELDILRDAGEEAAPTTQKKDLLTVDPQLSAGLLLLRLELNGAEL
jgi:carboxyl-terminal processing protease